VGVGGKLCGGGGGGGGGSLEEARVEKQKGNALFKQVEILQNQLAAQFTTRKSVELTFENVCQNSWDAALAQYTKVLVSMYIFHT